jgi:NADH dehydrogenase
MSPATILVLGGTGFVGQSVCEKLVERSGGAAGRIVVPTRRVARARHVQLLPTVQVVEADVHDDAQLARLVVGCDAVINLVAILHGSQAQFQRVHVDLPRRLGQACRAAGVRRVVHVSALGVGPSAPSRYLRSKTRGEAELAAAGLDLTVLRPSVIFGAQDKFLNLFAQLQAVAPFVPLAGASSRYQPVWVEDVAQAVVNCLDKPQSIGQTIECVGPEQYTLQQLVELAGRLSGHPRRVIPLPGPLARLQALAMECLPGEPLMSRDNLDSMRTPNVATGDHPRLAVLDIRPASLSSIAPGYLAPGRGPARLNPLRARARRP